MGFGGTEGNIIHLSKTNNLLISTLFGERTLPPEPQLYIGNNRCAHAQTDIH